MAKKLKTYEVEVRRTSSGMATFKVQAKDEVEAEQKAIEEACNHVYDSEDADYEVDMLEEVEE